MTWWHLDVQNPRDIQVIGTKGFRYCLLEVQQHKCMYIKTRKKIQNHQGFCSTASFLDLHGLLAPVQPTHDYG